MKSGTRRSLLELAYRLQTEADAPGEQAWAIGIGAAIGCLPVYGLHLPLCIVAARLLRLSRLKMYLAANLNNPLLGPLLVFLEIQIGHYLRRGELYSLAFWEEIKGRSLWHFANELIIGSICLAVVAGVALGVLAYVLLLRNTKGGYRRRLVEESARRFLHVGFTSWEFVRGKLHFDPVYLELVTRSWLPSHGLLLDLGCGRGILFALLATYREPRFQETRPQDCLPAPQELELLGIEASTSTVEVATSAGLPVRVGDLRTVELPACTCVTLLDVLHYLEEQEQERLLQRVRSALEPVGSLLIREVDGTWSFGYVITAAAERLRAILRGKPFQTLRYRPAERWAQLLRELGFEVSLHPMSHRTPFRNVLIHAKQTRR